MIMDSQEIIQYYNKIINIDNKESDELEEFYLKDRSEIFLSSAFRNLQQKTQVFPLEPNSNIRSRLTHTIEVFDIAGNIAKNVANEFIKKEIFNLKTAGLFKIIVKNSALLHDIGNPPFGHFGEEAIKHWYKNNWKTVASRVFDLNNKNTKLVLEKRIKDFLEFDGNPQGLRIALKLGLGNNNGLNLSHQTIVASIKYTRDTLGKRHSKITKKPGYFQSEADIIFKAYHALNLDNTKRLALTYIMEASDDIAYCFSDISDALQKKILSHNDFNVLFKDYWIELIDEKLLDEIPKNVKIFDVDFLQIKDLIIKEISQAYIKNQEKLIYNEVGELFELTDKTKKIMRVLKHIAKTNIYKSAEIEKLELLGFKVINELYHNFSKLLILSFDNFHKIICKNKGLSSDYRIESKLLNRIDETFLKNYIHELHLLDKNKETFYVSEWILRNHLVTDYISNMTDSKALNNYKLLQGIDAFIHF